jgi:hypothetical protein
MKRWNVLAAGLIAALFVVLALLPLTRDALRFDMQMASGRSVLGRALADLGIKQGNMGFANLGPSIPMSQDGTAAPSPEMSVRLANAMQLTGRQKWTALQQLVADFPGSPPAHAALTRMACKNGGSVDVGHTPEQYAFSTTPMPSGNGKSHGDPQDALIMLHSCEVGESIDPDNAYFPAMAAIALYALDQDSAARAALHRAVAKPYWREYFDAEVQGRVRRAELLHGPQNSLTVGSTMASMLLPHYAALRSLARVATAQAMYSEQAGDPKAGIALRRDVARLGDKMRAQSSTLIGGLVGMAMIHVAEQRPGGAPVLKKEKEDGEITRQRTDAQFLTYLTAQGEQAEAVRWQHYIDDSRETKRITQRASYVSAFGATTLISTEWKLLTNQFLLGAATLLCVLAGLALLRPWLGKWAGRAASLIAVASFIAIMSWMTWQTLGNIRDTMAFGNVIQALTGDSTVDVALARSQMEALIRIVCTEGTLGLLALLIPPIYVTVVAIRAKRQCVPMSLLLRRWTLPLAALLTLAYSVHLVAFSLRERAVRSELQQVVVHEGRYVAAKLGRTWPVTPDE